MTALSPQQYAVVECIHRALCDKQIARELGLTPGTVKVHVGRALKATGAPNRVALALMMERGQLVKREAPPRRYPFERGEPLRVVGGRLAGELVQYARVANSKQLYVQHGDRRVAVLARDVEREAA